METNNALSKLFNNSVAVIKYILNFIKRYYFVIIGLYFFKKALITAIYSNTGIAYKIYLFALVFACFTAYSEIRNDVKIIPFICCALPLLLFIWHINGPVGYNFWGKILDWEITKNIIINLNPIFSKIPFNNGSIFRIYQTKLLTKIMTLVYNNGFVLPVILPIYRAAIAKDFHKMIRYALSAHIFQIFLISPFYLMFHLQQVWYVLGQPDIMNRHFTPLQAKEITINCFPSMHVSIAFSAFLLVLREKNKLFKFVWGFFCISVMYSTLYLEVHWVLDVIGGMILAYVTIKIVDFVLAKGKKLLENPLRKIYYKNPDYLI